MQTRLNKIRTLFIILFLALLFEGCYSKCRNCAQGQEIAESVQPVTEVVYTSTELIVTATEYAEFRRVVLEIANNNLSELPNLLFGAITGATPPIDTRPVHLSGQPVYNSWFNLEEPKSFLNQCMWNVTYHKAQIHRVPEENTYNAALKVAPAYLPEATRLNRFLERLRSLKNPDSDF